MDIKNIEITEDHKKVIEHLNKGTAVIFISGKAGTGKSTLIQYFKATLKKNLAVVAPTGVAALNVEGSTIHSFFRFPPRFVMEDDIKSVYDRIYKKLEVLLIDEISMVRADQFDGIDRFLRKNGPDNNIQFGGVQVIMIGDLFQLPPVITPNEKPLFVDRGYETPFFFSSNAWKNLPESEFFHIDLKKIYRQKDTEFTDILNNIRIGEKVAESVAKINTTCCHSKSDDDLSITLTSTNAIADEINTTELNKLEGKAFTFEGQINGNFNLKDDKLPAPLYLKLKNGARVMFVKNDEEDRWVNGSMGIVREISDKKILVEVLPEGSIYFVDRVEWGTFRYELFEGKISPRKNGSYVQYPLMLSYAVTIHKSQGKTLNKIFIDFGNMAFAPGQVYVALSRSRAIGDVTLKRDIRVSEVKADERVKMFFKSLEQPDFSNIL